MTAREHSIRVLDRILGLRNAARYYDAVFEGGGVKAIGQIGAVEVFEQHGLVPPYLAGTSGGAIIAAALAMRGTSGEMAPIISSGDLTEYLDSRLLPNQAALRHLLYGISPMLATATLHYGTVRGGAFLDMIRRELRTMYNRHNPDGRRLGPDDDVTFDDLRFPQHHDDLDQPQRLRIVATDITRRKALQFPKDLSDYKRIESGPLSWTAGQGFPIALAVRMSMAIPALFEPVRAIDTDDVLYHIVDGGVSSNYPIWLFDSPKPPTAPTFGFLLDEKKGTDANTTKLVKHFLGFAMGMIGSGIGAIDRILSDHDNARTIRIDTCGVGTADFDLDATQRARFMDAGSEAARGRLEHFDWHGYVADFRGNTVGIPTYEDPNPPTAGGISYQLRT